MPDFGTEAQDLVKPGGPEITTEAITPSAARNELVRDAPPAGLGIPYVRLGIGLPRF